MARIKSTVPLTPEGVDQLNRAARTGAAAISDIKTLTWQRTAEQGKIFDPRDYEKAENFFKSVSRHVNKKGDPQLTQREFDTIRDEWHSVKHLVRQHRLADENLSDGRPFGNDWGPVVDTFEAFFDETSKAFGYGYGLEEDASPTTGATPAPEPPAPEAAVPAVIRFSREQSAEEFNLAAARLQALEDFKRDYPELADDHKAAIDQYQQWNRNTTSVLSPDQDNDLTEQQYQFNLQLNRDASAAMVEAKPEGEEFGERNLLDYIEEKAKLKLSAPEQNVDPVPVAEEPVIEPAEPKSNETASPEPSLPEAKVHTAAPGDKVWNIAASHYGIDKKDTARVQNAVNHIAYCNGLDEDGVHSIRPGQKILLPPGETLAGEAPSLDWEKLDRLALRDKKEADKQDRPAVVARGDLQREFRSAAIREERAQKYFDRFVSQQANRIEKNALKQGKDPERALDSFNQAVARAVEENPGNNKAAMKEIRQYVYDQRNYPSLTPTVAPGLMVNSI